MRRVHVGRVSRAALLLAVGFQGITSPAATAALGGSIPDCVQASPLIAWLGTTAHVMSPASDCPYGSYAPTDSYQTVAQAVLTGSLVAVLLGLLALAAGVGLGVHGARTVRALRRWFGHRFQVVATELTHLMAPQPQAVLVSPPAHPRRPASRPQLRRGPPFCP